MQVYSLYSVKYLSERVSDCYLTQPFVILLGVTNLILVDSLPLLYY
jgi:hypothetical protein